MRRNSIKRIVLRNRGALLGSEGFTLLEMLLVVAIISVLIVISIPFIGDSLETTRRRVDMANERTAAGLAKVNYLLEGKIVVDTQSVVLSDDTP